MGNVYEDNDGATEIEDGATVIDGDDGDTVVEN